MSGSVKQKSVIPMSVLAVAAILCGSAAQAAPPAFCKNYANRAVWQYKVMRSTPSCQQPPSNFWHADRTLHFEWCLTAHPHAVNDQSHERDSQLSACNPSYGD